ncbi:hypothetical protein P4V64_29625 [Bacillus thuringiensis]|nr:hypothetical protein [Bacillus thuringiensis]
MEITTALSVLKQLNKENFCWAFQRMFSKFFHMNDLEFWCELTGICKKDAFKDLLNKGWLPLGKEFCVYGTIETLEELAEFCSFYNLQKKDIKNSVVNVLKESEGYLPIALKQLPLSYDVVRTLLELQDELIPLTPLNWFSKHSLPDQLKVVSRYVYSKYCQWDELIIATFVKAGKPLRLDEIIYQYMGVVPASNELKCMFNFMLNILPIHKIDNTEYWALSQWEKTVDLSLIDRITTLLSEQGRLSLGEISKGLINYEDSRIFETLSFWPEFALHSDNKYWLNIAPMDNELLAIIVPSLLKLLVEAEGGIPTQQILKHAEMIAKSRGLNIHVRDFKSFLKGWGEAAIVGGRVYAMHKAPFHLMRLGDVAYLILKENGAPMEYSELEAEIRQRRNYHYSISSVFLTEPKLSRPSRGYWALREWGLIEYDPQIHIRIGEVLVSIIEKAGRPVHKAEIRQQLRRSGMNMNEVTLHMDLTENERIQQVARGVYALAEWNLSFRDLFRFKFPFRLSLPDGNPTIYELEEGIIIEYFISKLCLELGRILVKRHMKEYFPYVEQYTKYTVTDFTGASYEGWVDRFDEGRYQFLGLQRWYKTHKPRYGENIYIYIPKDKDFTFTLLSAEQADTWIYDVDNSVNC